MKKTHTILFLIFVTFCNSLTLAQQYSKSTLKQIDSLNNILEDSKTHDTSRVEAINVLSEILYAENIDTVIYMSNQIIAICDEMLTKKITKREKNVFKKYLSNAYNNIGFVENYHGKVQLSLDFYHKSLKIKEEINDPDGLSTAYLNLGSVYSDQGDSDLALEYYSKSLEFDKQLNDLDGVSTNYNNIALVYLELNKVDTSLYYLQKSLQIREKLNNKFSIAISLNNIGSVYQKIGQHTLAKEYFVKSLNLYESIKKKSGICHELAKLAEIHLNEGDLLIAKKQATKSLKLSQEIGYPKDIKLAAQTLSEVYRLEGNGLQALKYYKLMVKITDSLNNNAISKYKIQKQAEYEYEKKTVEDSLKQAQLHGVQMAIVKTKAEEEDKKKKILMIGLIILAILLGLLFRRFNITKKQKQFIEKQKSIVEGQHHQLAEVHKEISDSINYAKRLQNAIFPPLKLFNDSLKDTFVMFKPKDVVSGDFYWLFSSENDVFFAAADCTGHGVPGAMVSVVCGNALNRAVKEFKLKSPAKILDKTRELVIETFSRSGTDVKDGMDIALCKLNNNLLTFSGANNPLWLIKNTNNITTEQLNSKSTLTLNNKTLVEFKPNKQPIGLYEKNTPFSEMSIRVEKGDKIFIFSDGFADQFGGERGKKMKYKIFKNLILANQHLSMPEIKEKLNDFFNDWKGDYEQLDDVVVIGVNVC